jgi:hypothetical protein
MGSKLAAIKAKAKTTGTVRGKNSEGGINPVSVITP